MHRKTVLFVFDVKRPARGFCCTMPFQTGMSFISGSDMITGNFKYILTNIKSLVSLQQSVQKGFLLPGTMEIIQICPKCGLPAQAVNTEAIKYNVVESLHSRINFNNKWSVCVNPVCDCSYFSKHTEFRTTDLIVPLFFKDSSDSAPICYCSNLTRGEIKNAVRIGCKNIDDVQSYTGKDITGLCHERNPLGKCCRKVFLKTISDFSNE